MKSLLNNSITYASFFTKMIKNAKRIFKNDLKYKDLNNMRSNLVINLLKKII